MDTAGRRLEILMHMLRKELHDIHQCIRRRDTMLLLPSDRSAHRQKLLLAHLCCRCLCCYSSEQVYGTILRLPVLRRVRIVLLQSRGDP